MRSGARAIIPAAVIGLLLAAAARDHYFRDEFYYLACSRHMAWGYVDQPPLSIAILWVVRHLFGESLVVLRGVAALSLAWAVLVTGSIARRLGGGGFAELLAMLAAAAAPILLGVGSFYSMNVFDVLFWTLAARVFVEIMDRPSARLWMLLGLILGLGLLNKISVLWLCAGFAATIVLTSARRSLRTPGPYIAAAVAAALFLPHVLWQVANGWPTLEFIRNAGRDKMLVTDPLSFVVGQVMAMQPVTLPIWAGGLAALFVHPRLRRYRALGISFLIVAAIVMLNRTSRAEYLTPAYPALLAAGGVFWEGVLGTRRWRRAAVVLVALAGLATAPLAVPILPVDAYVRYSRALGVAPSTEERKELGRLPQFFADRQGWDAFVGQVQAVWDRLPSADRGIAAVYTNNYGEAGAVQQLGSGMVAISGHNNYWLWGPQGRTGEVLVVLSGNPERLAQRFEHVERAGEIDCGDCMPYENHLGIYICRRMRPPLLPDRWPQLKHYD